MGEENILCPNCNKFTSRGDYCSFCGCKLLYIDTQVKEEKPKIKLVLPLILLCLSFIIAIIIRSKLDCVPFGNDTSCTLNNYVYMIPLIFMTFVQFFYCRNYFIITDIHDNRRFLYILILLANLFVIIFAFI